MFHRNFLILVIVSTLVITGLTMELTFSQHSFNPKNQKDYAQYLKFVLGSNNFNEELGKEFKQFIIENRISLFDAVEEIVIILSDYKEDIQSAINKFEISQDFISNIESQIDRITIVNMKGATSQQIANKKSEFEKMGKKCHQMRGSTEEILEMQNMFKKHHNGRMLEQVQDQNKKDNENQATNQGTNAEISPSYLIKFFFIIIFLLVCLSTLLAIANMQNNRDTLLYAKFIADVGR